MSYDSYFDSDVSWIGKLPATWRMIPNKYLFQKRQIKVGSKFTDYQLLSLTTTGVKEKDINDSKGKTPTSFEGYQEVRSGDMIFCLFDLDVSAVFSGISNYNGMITSAYDVTECNSKYILGRYADYWFKKVFSNRYYKIYSKNVRYTISFDAFGGLKTPVPPIDEQEQIVKYLDWQISKINALIAAKRNAINLIKERQRIYASHAVICGIKNEYTTKESNIDWIGRIPAHWEVWRCKYLFSERDERSLEGKEQHLSMSQKYGLVPDTQLDERRMLSASYKGGKICHKNDLVLNRLKAHLGVFAISPQMGVISPDYTVLIPNTKRILPAYAEAVLKSDKCRRELRIRVRGIIEGFWRLYTDDFNTIVLPLPPLNEQQEIMDHIQECSEKTKGYEKRLNDEIRILQELRIRLISDAVTGKIDVRGIEIPEYEFVDEDTDTDNEDDGEEDTEEQEGAEE